MDVSRREAGPPRPVARHHEGRQNPPRATGTSNGGMGERAKPPVLKTGEPEGSVGSNPTPSATRGVPRPRGVGTIGA